MGPKVKETPHYDSDDESIPPPPPPETDASKEAFIDHQKTPQDHSGATTTPSRKWRLLKKEAEHVLIPQDNFEDVAAATSAANQSPNPVQGYFRGLQVAQRDEEEEAGMDDIEIPSSSIVARLNGIEKRLRRKKTLFRTGLIFLVLLIAVAIITGSIFGTRKSNPVFNTPAAKFLKQNLPEVYARSKSSSSAQYTALKWITDKSVNGDFNYADPATFDSEDAVFAFQQRYAAACLYEGLTEQDWADTSFWMSNESICNWHGIVCDGNTVVKIDLTDNLLRGVLPPEVGLMTGLQQLILVSNWIGGTLPNELGNLNELVTLDLYDNLLTATLPDFSTLTQLAELYIGSNEFSGTIPDSWQGMTSLEYLWLDDLSLTGTIPSFIFDLPALVVLKMSNSGVNGAIPSNVGDLGQITYLNLAGNALSGGLPDSVADLPLDTLILDENPNLFDVDGGVFPSFLLNVSTLQELSLSNTGLRGPLPNFIVTTFPNLIELDLSKNSFTGSIPLVIAWARKLEVILLNDNDLEGGLPWSFSDLENLRLVNVSNNNLTGTIPNEYNTLVNLELFIDGTNIN